MSKSIFSRSIVSTKVVNCLPQVLLLQNKEVKIKNGFGDLVCNVWEHMHHEIVFVSYVLREERLAKKVNLLIPMTPFKNIF